MPDNKPEMFTCSGCGEDFERTIYSLFRQKSKTFCRECNKKYPLAVKEFKKRCAVIDDQRDKIWAEIVEEIFKKPRVKPTVPEKKQYTPEQQAQINKFAEDLTSQAPSIPKHELGSDLQELEKDKENQE